MKTRSASGSASDPPATGITVEQLGGIGRSSRLPGSVQSDEFVMAEHPVTVVGANWLHQRLPTRVRPAMPLVGCRESGSRSPRRIGHQLDDK